MVLFDRNHWRSFTLWLQKEENQQEIKEWGEHINRIYPQIKEDPDWLIKKYRKF